MEEFCREDDSVVVVQWKDTKTVSLVSVLDVILLPMLKDTVRRKKVQKCIISFC